MSEVQVQEDLSALWGQVVSQVAGDGPNKAVLQLARPLGLLKGAGAPNLLIATPNAFVKDIIDVRLRNAISESLAATLNEKVNFAVTVDESLELPEAPEPTKIAIVQEDVWVSHPCGPVICLRAACFFRFFLFWRITFL